MDDKADPSSGWPVLNILRTPSPAPQDWYGKLFIYIHNMLENFLDRLQKIRIDFILHHVDVRELPPLLQHNKYARIEVCFPARKLSFENKFSQGGQHL